ncbi:MAG: hypothetical protein H6673_03160 [Anaerolineales bacterium]|nr:hypothetical protein [Anaerolineales bacterium]
MRNPFRQIKNIEAQINQGINKPASKMRQMQSQGRRAARQPGNQVRSMKGQAKQIAGTPGREMRRAKSQAQGVGRSLRPKGGRAQKLQKASSGGKLQGMRNMYPGQGPTAQGIVQTDQRGRRYKRRADRMALTDLAIGALLYPLGWWLTWFGNLIADWDTAFIRYHLVHARMLSLIGFLFVPISAVLLLIEPPLALLSIIPMLLLWGYTWYLGFKAYSGQLVIIPLLTRIAERRNLLDFETLERMQGGGVQQAGYPNQPPPPYAPPPPPPPYR